MKTAQMLDKLMPDKIRPYMPQSLFARTVVLFISMLVISNIASFVIFLIFFTQPIAESTSEYVAQHINTIELSLKAMKPAQKKRYLQKMVDSGMIYFYSFNEPEKGLPGRAAEHFYEPPFEKALRQRLLDNNYRIRFEVDKLLKSDKPRIIWVEIKINNKPLWIGTPLSSFERPFPWNWISYFLFLVILTLLTSYLIARRIKSPLQELVCAADELGRGEIPEPINASGPVEITTMARAFNNMAVDIKKLADDRNLMLAGISHDLRTPLARVRLAIEMLDSNIEPELLNGMIEDIENIDKIVGQFLTFVRDGVDEVENTSDLNAMIEHMAARYALEGKQLKLNLAPLPAFSFKPLAMQRLLTNLINNAWNYGKQDVSIETAQRNSNIHICVLDRGPGIEQKDIEKLKQPFTRKQDSRTDTTGAGLGLAIVDRIVDWHGGELLISGREGGGLKVCVVLPIKNN